MRVAVATDVRYARDPAGRIHCRSGGTAYAFWQRYLAVFDEVRVIARVFDAPAGASLDAAPAGAAPGTLAGSAPGALVEGPVAPGTLAGSAPGAPVEGPGVRVSPLPGFDGPRGLALHAPAVVASAWRALAGTPAVIVRGPATMGFLCARLARLRGQPVGVEVVGDPLDIFGAGVGRGAAPVFREIFVRDLRWQCARACAVAYVTAGTLQARYPARPGVFVTHYSSVDLGPEAVVAAPRVHARPLAAPRLVTVGQLEQLYKGTDVLLGALRRLVAQGSGARLTIVGDGRFRPFLEELAGRLGVRERVTFAGLVPAGAGVRAELDRADLFVLPSRAEGLPRALIEAMARGLPAIGARVGGIPELLPDDTLVPPDDEHALATAIARAAAEPAWLDRMSRENLSRANEYRADLLAARRRAFYEHVRAAAAATASR